LFVPSLPAATEKVTSTISEMVDVTFAVEQQGRDVLEAIKTLLRAEWAGKEIALLTD
jgi:hypothetical protein